MRNKGITLIALVISIIVLLILAGISISMLSGDNGILQKATDAKTNTDNAKIQERINLAYHSSLVGGQGEVTETSLESELKKEFNKTALDEGWLDKTSVSGKWRITIDGVYLDIPASIDETQLSTDESTKLYDALKKLSIQEIGQGVTIDGKTTTFLRANYDGFYIGYDNKIYKLSIDNTPSLTSVSLLDNSEGKTLIIFDLDDGTHLLPAYEGMTFGEWVETNLNSIGCFVQELDNGKKWICAGSNYPFYINGGDFIYDSDVIIDGQKILACHE